jgi:hypothetical protein
MDKLKPCPFCGCGAETYQYSDDITSFEPNCWGVHCVNCSANVGGCVAETDAIFFWNKRIDNPEIDHLRADNISLIEQINRITSVPPAKPQTHEVACPECDYPHCSETVQYCHNCGYNFWQWSSEDANSGFDDPDLMVRKGK